MLTREERLWTMKGQDLIRVADKCGVKVSCNKARTQLKESKEAVILRILDAEAAEAKAVEPKPVEAKAVEPKPVEAKAVEPKPVEAKAVEPKPVEAKAVEPKPVEAKTKNQITYKNKTQSIKDWGKELGIPYHTLYDRIKRNGWTIAEAIETPLGQRRPKQS